MKTTFHEEDTFIFKHHTGVTPFNEKTGPIQGALLVKVAFYRLCHWMRKLVPLTKHVGQVRFQMCLKEKRFNCAWFSINPTLILFGHDGKTTTDEAFDFILLHAKFFVYRCRLNELKPKLEAFINNLKHIYEVDKHVHLMEMTHEQFVKKWTLYNHLVSWMCSMTFVCTSVNLTCLTCVLLETMYAHTHINVYLQCFNTMMTKYNL